MDRSSAPRSRVWTRSSEEGEEMEDNVRLSMWMQGSQVKKVYKMHLKKELETCGPKFNQGSLFWKTKETNIGEAPKDKMNLNKNNTNRHTNGKTI
jgi:hypothetical protein